MLIEAGKVYKTRDGRKARVLCVDALGEFNVIAAVLRFSGCSEASVDFRGDGRFDALSEHGVDLVEEWREPVKVSGWVNVYLSDSGHVGHATRFEADLCGGSERIACVYVSGTEGVEPPAGGGA